MSANLEHLKVKREELAIKLLGLYKKANAGHIGSSLSCLEILIFLYHHSMRSQDITILSKGHAAGALYVVLDSVGKLGVSLDTFYGEGTLLAGHPPCGGQIPAIPFGTGSLGHGLSIACGLALSSKLSGEDRRVYCILSDGDCNEGSTWEALHFAAHHQLSNLTIVLDLNGLQGIGRSEDILRIEPMAEKMKLLGIQVAVASNGNSFQELLGAHNQLTWDQGARCLVAHTTKGHGVSYMEGKMEWHYLPMSEDQFLEATREQPKVGAK